MARPPDNKTIVSLVADGLLRRHPEKVVIEKLIAAGIGNSDAPTVFRQVKEACQQGVQAVITNGLSSPNGPPRDPLLAEAFRVGQTSMRSSIRKVWLMRAVTAGIALTAIGAAVGLLVR